MPLRVRSGAESPTDRYRELQLAVAVRIDFAAEADLFNLWGFPFHASTFSLVDLPLVDILAGFLVSMQDPVETGTRQSDDRLSTRLFTLTL